MSLSTLYSVFETAEGAVYQCDKSRSLIVDFGGEPASYRLCTFLRLRQMVNEIDVDSKISSANRADDLEVIMPPQSDRCYLLTIQATLHFQELLNGAMAMLNLNCMLSELNLSFLPVEDTEPVLV
ncbi:MAG: hypothetical protein MI784_01460 [Cytophagales bacterium]|nr:hypothetical protein [Cytophagales bacterium]